MFLTIYLTCAIWGTLTNLLIEPYDTHAGIIIPLSMFAYIFGWIGLAVTILHGLGYLS